MKRRATYIPTDREQRLGVALFYATAFLGVGVWALIIIALLNGWAA